MSEEQDLEQLKRLKEQEAQIRTALKVVLDEKAFERLSFIKVSNETLYAQVISYIFSLYNGGRLKQKIDEEQLKKIASLFLSQRRETKIVRKSK